MRQYRITGEMRTGLNNYLGIEYLKGNDVGRDLYYVRNYDTIARVSPDKAKVLMATLFPEELENPGFLTAHKDEIKKLAHNIHVTTDVVAGFDWTSHLLMKEASVGSFEGRRDEDIQSNWIIRLR